MSFAGLEKKDIETLDTPINFIINSLIEQNQTINYLVFGDSNTIGQGVMIRNTWPKLLENSIEKEIGIKVNT